MATFEQEQSQRQTLQQVVDQIIAIDPETLVRADVLGRELSFASGLPVFRRTIGLFKELAACSLDNVPFETLQQLNAQANQAVTQFQQIKNFSVTQNSNPTQFRDGLIQQLRDNWHRCVFSGLSCAVGVNTASVGRVSLLRGSEISVTL